MAGFSLIHEDDVLWVAMPLYGSGSRFPEGVYTDKDACYEAQGGDKAYHKPLCLPFKLNQKGVADA